MHRFTCSILVAGTTFVGGVLLSPVPLGPPSRPIVFEGDPRRRQRRGPGCQGVCPVGRGRVVLSQVSRRRRFGHRVPPPAPQEQRNAHHALGPSIYGRSAAGKYTFTVERGKEYQTLVQELVVESEPISLELKLHRWIDMAGRGWYSGDTHIHRDLADMPNVILAGISTWPCRCRTG